MVLYRARPGRERPASTAHGTGHASRGEEHQRYNAPGLSITSFSTAEYLPSVPDVNRVSPEDRAWAESLLKKTGIWEQRFQKPGELSGGECQRTAVVRALINKPKLILADEPTGALDEENASILAELLAGLGRDEGITLVTVTHAPDFARKMDIIHRLHNGQLILEK